MKKWRRPGEHCLYEETMESCLHCGGAPSRSLKIIRNSDTGKPIGIATSIECSQCGVGVIVKHTDKNKSDEEYTKEITDFWNNDDNWKSIKPKPIKPKWWLSA